MKPSHAVSALAAAMLTAVGAAAPAAAAEPRDTIPTGTYLIVSTLTSECMVLTGTNITASPCIDYRAVWTIEPAGVGTDEVYIRQGLLCVSDIVDTVAGGDVSALPCIGTDDERWTFIGTPGFGFQIAADADRVAVIQPPLDYEEEDFIRVETKQDILPEFWGLYPI